MTTTLADTDFGFDITPFLVDVDQEAPNPYEREGVAQDAFDVAELAEGLGGFPQAPLTVWESRQRLHDLIASKATKLWDGSDVVGHCLSVQRQAAGIPPLHYSAWQDWQENPDQHPCALDTVDWSKVPIGARLYYQSGAGGSGYGHIVMFIGIHNGKPVVISNDVIPGRMGYANPEWFEIHWGQTFVGWAGVVNGYDVFREEDTQHGNGGNGGKGDVPWPVLRQAQIDVGWAHNRTVRCGVEPFEAVLAQHPHLKAVQEARDAARDAARKLHASHDALTVLTGV